MSENGHIQNRTIKVGLLARVEGEGSLHVRIKDGHVLDTKLKIFEPPRFFEAILRGRSYLEAPDITARICGICPIAYQISSSHAMEDACGVRVTDAIRNLRRLIYCGEWIESHALHIFMLHLPDFLGYDDAITMARDHRDTVSMGLRLKKLGNQIMTVVGGREVHPVNIRVGGFYRMPTRIELAGLRPELEWARDAAVETLHFLKTLTYPDFERDYEYVALHRPDEYAVLDGRLKSNRGLDIPLYEFNGHFIEEQVAHSTSLHARLRDREAYVVGPLARYNLNFDQLSDAAREAALDLGPGPSCHNPFRSIQVRAVELLYACDLAIDLIDRYETPQRPFMDTSPRPAVGFGCTEAPRGICWHRYRIDAEGQIRDATIVPPTSQNQASIEADLRDLVERHLDLDTDELTWKCEQAVRNYDPCISCSCHFLKLEITHAAD